MGQNPSHKQTIQTIHNDYYLGETWRWLAKLQFQTITDESFKVLTETCQANGKPVYDVGTARNIHYDDTDSDDQEITSELELSSDDDSQEDNKNTNEPVTI